ncbi:MAG: DUF1801 domain-containing protein [Boseongicola sp.]|nr:MAG: DUF1801 domain-containing protein [Boseongicola sp.]
MAQGDMFASADVAKAFDAIPADCHSVLLALRRLIYQVAIECPEVGRVEEWGQPAYLTSETKSGTTVRLGQARDGRAAIFTHCQTSVVSEFRQIFPEAFEYDGTRAVLLGDLGDAKLEKLAFLMQSALTYHLR